MENKKVRWGVLGCARIAIGAVIPGIQQSKTGEVVAIASRDKSKAQAAARDLGIPHAYDGYEKLLSDDGIDAVYIPLPNHLHKEWTVRAAEAGKHVLCEKPLALNAEEALHMVDACERAGVKLAEAFMYRHHPRHDRIKAIVQSGEIGVLRGIHGTFTFNNAQDTANVRVKRSMGGGALYDVGCYPISAARFILETEPEAATVHAFFSPEHDDVDMMASGLIEFPGHVGMTFDCSMWAEFRNTLEILGADGRIEVPSAFVGSPDFTVIAKGERREETFPQLNQYSLQADSFGRSILFDEPLRFEPMDGVKNMRAIDACLLSAQTRMRVVIRHPSVASPS
ncbi:MAG: Gfo/Idh/MocA family protein [Bacilli bacterium]